MNYTDTSVSREAPVTPQFLHREAVVHLEKAVKHHQQAALLHDNGDASQAESHGSIAYNHTAHALEASGRAMNVLLW